MIHQLIEFLGNGNKSDSSKGFGGNWIVFLSFFVFALVLRTHTLFAMVLDHDESTYAVIADHILNGSFLYKDVLDVKQPGIFLIFASIQMLFGKSIVIIRIVAILAVSSSGYFLFLFKRREGFDWLPSLLSGGMFIILFNYFFGLSANTEIFFIWCFLLGLLVFQKRSSLSCLLAGLIIGFGFIIKQHVIFDFAALGLFFLITSIIDKQFLDNLPKMILMVVGFIIPFLTVHLYFLWNGQFDHYQDITYTLPNSYISSLSLSERFYFMGKGFLKYLIPIVMAIFGWFSQKLTFQMKVLISLLLLFDMISINFTGKTFNHYFLQLAVPLAFLAGEIGTFQKFKSFVFKPIVLKIFMIILFLYSLLLSVFYCHFRFEPSREVYYYLKPRINEQTTIYSAGSPQILYWLLDKKSPTKFVHSTLLTNGNHIHALSINLHEELNAILEQKPDFIILSNDYPHKWFVDEVINRYMLSAQLTKNKIYELKSNK